MLDPIPVYQPDTRLTFFRHDSGKVVALRAGASVSESVLFENPGVTRIVVYVNKTAKREFEGSVQEVDRYYQDEVQAFVEGDWELIGLHAGLDAFLRPDCSHAALAASDLAMAWVGKLSVPVSRAELSDPHLSAYRPYDVHGFRQKLRQSWGTELPLLRRSQINRVTDLAWNPLADLPVPAAKKTISVNSALQLGAVFQY